MPVTQELGKERFEVLIVCEGKDDKEVVEMLCSSLGLLEDVNALLTYSRGRANIADHISTLRKYLRRSKTLVVLTDADEKEPERVIEELESDLRMRGLDASSPREKPFAGQGRRG